MLDFSSITLPCKHLKIIYYGKEKYYKFDQVEDLIIELRGNQVLIDADVAALYQVETKEINQAVKNNPRKFPKGYVFTTTDEET